MENTESRIAPSPEAASDDFASPSNSSEGEPPDRLAFEPVPLRHRCDGFTPEKQRAYVEALADCGIAREAAARVGLTEQAIARVRRRSDARSFDRACEAAHLFGARRIRSTLWERAIEGTVRGRYYRGELIAEERVFDNRLLTYLYGKVAHLLERDEAKSLAICANWEAHMDALEQGLEKREPPKPADDGFTGYEVWKDDAGVWWTCFPPPAGFDGEEQHAFGEDGYQRTLSYLEQSVVDAELDEDDAEYRAVETARRDRFFGFLGSEVSSSLEAETYETSEPSEPARGPIEYKSLYPPPAAAPTIHAEARRRGGIVPGPGHRPASRGSGRPYPAGFAGESPETPPFRASAPPRESLFRRNGTMGPNLSPAPRIP
ncbi:MAG TPA: hypothetical protein VF718_12230 [Allosphingosinicella sp.]|jgi:hypothetical protein